MITHSRQVTDQTTVHTHYAYEWWDEAKQKRIEVEGSQPGVRNWAPGYSDLTYDVNGHLLKAVARDGQPRTLNYFSDSYGQIMLRETTSGAMGPRQHYYYFDGKRIGDVGNNGPERVDYAEALAARERAQSEKAPKNGFRNGKPVASADFDQNYEPISPSYPSNVASNYTVRQGDTLRAIASAVWGDASLWYLIAEANGLSGAETLVAGQILVIPNKVANIHNTSETFRPYNPGEAIGDAMPILPDQPAPPRAKGGGCGIVGQIILVVIAVVVSIYTAGAASALLAGQGLATAGTAGMAALGGGGLVAGTGLGGAIAAGAIGGAVGSIVSQAVGVATGIQDEFSWKGVALAAISGGVGAGLGKVPFLNGAKQLPGQIAQGAARGAVGNALTQGIAVATGLQDEFDWTGVAVGAVVGGTSAAAGGWLASNNNFGLSDWAVRGITGALSAVAGAATRSAIDGTDFGDAIEQAIPDVIGQTIGDMIAGKISSEIQEARFERAQEALRKMLGSIGNAGIGGAGGTYELPTEGAQRRAYDAARAQNASEEFALEVAQVVAAREAFGREVFYDQAVKGMIGEVLDYASLSTDAYFAQSIDELRPAGVRRVVDASELAALGLSASDLNVPASGYFAALYADSRQEIYVNGSRATSYILANRGTEGFTAGLDWSANFEQFFGIDTPQYRQAISVARRLDERGVLFTTTGHSLGGGLAIAQATATGHHAYVFNAAAVRRETLGFAGIVLTEDQFQARLMRNVDAFAVPGDILTSGQDMKGIIGALNPPPGSAFYTLREAVGTEGVLAYMPDQIMDLPMIEATRLINAGPSSPPHRLLPLSMMTSEHPYVKGGGSMGPVQRHSMASVAAGIYEVARPSTSEFWFGGPRGDIAGRQLPSGYENAWTRIWGRLHR